VPGARISARHLVHSLFEPIMRRPLFELLVGDYLSLPTAEAVSKPLVFSSMFIRTYMGVHIPNGRQRKNHHFVLQQYLWNFMTTGSLHVDGAPISKM